MPAPRRVRRRPFVQWQAPLVWTTLSLTIHADGTAEGAMTGHSRFPRHWIYDDDGRLTHKSGLADFKDWYRKSFGRHTPWGDTDSKALVTAVETALERRLSAQIMQGGAKPAIRRVQAGTALVRQGETGSEVFLLLDGVLRVEEDGRRLAEYGPGRAARGAGTPGGRPANLDARGGDAVQGGGRRGRAARSWSAARAVQGSPPHKPRPELSSLRIHFCGVRGSTPAPGIDFVRYGGHTSCLALAQDGAARRP